MKYNLLGAASTIALGVAAGAALQSGAKASPIFFTGQQTQSVTVGNSVSINGTFAFSGYTAPVIPGANVHFHDVDLAVTLIREILSDTAKITNAAPIESVGLSFGPDPLTAHASVTLTGLGAVAGLFSASNAVTTPGFSGTITQAIAKTTVATTLVGPVTLLNTTLLSGLAPFTSGWSAKVHYSSGQGGSVPGDVLTGNDGSASMVFSLSYSYTTTAALTTTTSDTPEPATLAVLGVGLAGLGAIRRRRARKI